MRTLNIRQLHTLIDSLPDLGSYSLFTFRETSEVEFNSPDKSLVILHCLSINVNNKQEQ